MKKKVVYIHAKTGKEVTYGEIVSIKLTKKFKNNDVFTKISQLPVNNDTIPFLIETGILIQKEVEIEDIQPNKINKAENNKDVDTIIEHICQTYKKQEQLLGLLTTQIEILSSLLNK